MTQTVTYTETGCGIVPPHDENLERAVLSALIVEPRQVSEVVNILPAEAFYSPKHEAIYRAILDLYDANDPITILAVGNRLERRGFMPERIKPVELSVLATEAGSASGTEAHARTIVEKWIARRMLGMGREITARAGSPTEDIDDVNRVCDGRAGKDRGRILRRSNGRPHQSLYRPGVEGCGTAGGESKGEVTGITTGLSMLDRATGGWQGAQLVILAARPAMGKTALMLHFAKSAARAGVPVCIYSLEMSGVRLSDRLLLSAADVDAYSFRSGRMNSEDWRRVETAGAEISRLPIYIDENSTVSMRYIKTNSRIRASRGECGMIMIDYLQLVDTTDKTNRNRNREQEVAQASRQAKIIAKELNVPVVLLSQLSRGVEGRSDKCPILSDLRESGAIEQDADIVAFVYRPAYYNIPTVEDLNNVPSEGVGVISIAKQRDGGVGKIAFRHNPAMTRITDFDDATSAPAPTSTETPF